MRPIKTYYLDRWWSLWALEKTLGIGWGTLKRWRQHGGISAARIERHLRDRAERRRLLALARAHGVPDHIMRLRVYRGATGDEAATTPVQPARGGRRKAA